MGGHGGGAGSEVRSTHHVSPAPCPSPPVPPAACLSTGGREGQNRARYARFFCRAVRGKEDPRPAGAAANFDFGQGGPGPPNPRPARERGRRRRRRARARLKLGAVLTCRLAVSEGAPPGPRTACTATRSAAHAGQRPGGPHRRALARPDRRRGARRVRGGAGPAPGAPRRPRAHRRRDARGPPRRHHGRGVRRYAADDPAVATLLTTAHRPESGRLAVRDDLAVLLGRTPS